MDAGRLLDYVQLIAGLKQIRKSFTSDHRVR